MSIGNKIRSTRTERGLSLASLAREAELTHGYLSRVENEKQIPAAEHVETLAGVLGVDADDLIAERDKSELARRGLDPSVAEVAVEMNRRGPEERRRMVEALNGLLKATEPDEPGTTEGRGPGR